MPIEREFIKPLLPVDSVSRDTIPPQEGTTAQEGLNGPHRDRQPAPSCLEAAGGKPEPGLPYRKTPRPVGCSGRNRGSGSLFIKTKVAWLPFWCQCQDCLETFSIDALILVNGDRTIIKLESHPRVAHNQNSTYYHRCGGNGYMKGRLALYPTLKFWRS